MIRWNDRNGAQRWTMADFPETHIALLVSEVLLSLGWGVTAYISLVIVSMVEDDRERLFRRDTYTVQEATTFYMKWRYN